MFGQRRHKTRSEVAWSAWTGGKRGRRKSDVEPSSRKSSVIRISDTSSYFLARIYEIHYYGLRRKYYGLRRNSYEHGGCVNDTGWCVTIYIMLYM